MHTLGFKYIIGEDGAHIVGYDKVEGALEIPAAIDGTPVVAIDADAFRYNETLTEVVIPGSVKSIGESAFYWCVALTNVEFSEGLESIGENAFSGCSSLKAMEIPDSVTELGLDSVPTAIETLKLPAGIEVIPYGMFDCYATYYEVRG